MAPRKETKKLSKHLLDMKFMRNSREKIREREEEEDCRLMFYKNISDELKSSSSKYIIENSYVVCEGLTNGRRSYRGMNEELEKILQLENDDKTLIKRIKEEDVDVTAEEMLEFRRQRSTLVETVGKKFQKKRSNDNLPNKKVKFMKPNDE